MNNRMKTLLKRQKASALQKQLLNNMIIQSLYWGNNNNASFGGGIHSSSSNNNVKDPDLLDDELVIGSLELSSMLAIPTTTPLLELVTTVMPYMGILSWGNYSVGMYGNSKQVVRNDDVLVADVVDDLDDDIVDFD